MYEFVFEAESKRYRTDCSDVLTKTCSLLKEKGITAKYTLIGSGAKNLITRNGNGPYDLDYNLEVVNADKRYRDDLRFLKETIRTALNEAEGDTFFSDARDSTSVLTAILSFKDEPQVEFSFDVAIITKNHEGTMCRLIHNKNAFGLGSDQYTWCEIPSSKNVYEKAKAIKEAGKWLDVRKRYLDLKNYYLSLNDRNHPSYVVYVEAVNEIFGKLPKKSMPEVKSNLKVTKNILSNAPCNKTLFNCQIQKVLSNANKYDNKIISYVASFACENYSGKKTKKDVRNNLNQKYGQQQGNEIYNRIASLLK